MLRWLLILPTVRFKTKRLVHFEVFGTVQTALQSINLVNSNFIELIPMLLYSHFFLEFQKIAIATAIGFAIMGFIGFFVKLIHIPINNIIVQ